MYNKFIFPPSQIVELHQRLPNLHKNFLPEYGSFVHKCLHTKFSKNKFYEKGNQKTIFCHSPHINSNSENHLNMYKSLNDSVISFKFDNNLYVML